MPSKRIKVELPLPSISLKRFLEKTIADDDFFALALENPVGALRDCGVNLDASAFIPPDFATFFGALAGLKAVIREKKLTDMTFEKIFGQVAVIRGAILDAELTRGFFREWDNRDAFTEREQCFSTEQKFEVVRERLGTSIKDALIEREVELRAARSIDMYRDVSETFESRSTDNHTDTHWDQNDMQRSSESTRGTNQNFEKSGLGATDYLRGPLINPVDLATLATRIELQAQLLKETL